MEEPSPSRVQKRSGFEIFLYSLLGIGALFFVAAMVGLYFLFATEKGQKLVRGAQEVSALAMEGMSAPGTEELRALGCQTAMVSTTERFAEAMGLLGLDVGPREPEPGRKDLTMVFCHHASRGDSPPDCSAVAAAYGAAVDAPAEFAVVVGSRPSGETECQGLFSPSGERLGDIGTRSDEPSP